MKEHILREIVIEATSELHHGLSVAEFGEAHIIKKAERYFRFRCLGL